MNSVMSKMSKMSMKSRKRLPSPPRLAFAPSLLRSAAQLASLASLVLLLGVAACGSTAATQPDLSSPSEEPSGSERSPDSSSQVAAEPESPVQAPAESKPAPAASPNAGLSEEATAILAAHNQVRATHCARPLAWSAALAATAQEWANSLRDSGCRFEHSQTAYGENLAAGTRLSAANAVQLWTDEVTHYNYKRPGFSMKTGHFTQVVWSSSRSIGCGYSECQGMRLWVCHYDPPGNVMSLFPENVSPPTCK